MGLYSINRVDSVNESYDFDETVIENCPNLLESCIQLQEMDQKMFESLITLDFEEAINEAEGDNNEAAAEAKKEKTIKKIWEAIKNAVSKVIEVIKKAFYGFIDKVNELMMSDTKFIKKYKAVTLAKWDDKKAPTLKGGFKYKVNNTYAQAKAEFDKQNGIFNSTESDYKEKIDKQVEEFDKFCKEFKLEKAEKDKDKEVVITKEIFELACQDIENKKSEIKISKDHVAEAKKVLEEAKKEKKATKKVGNAVAIAQTNGYYRITSKYCSLVQKISHFEISEMARMYANKRKAIIKAYRAMNGYGKKEESYIYEASDEYVLNTLSICND